MDQKVIDRLYDDLKIDQKPGQGFKYVKTRYVLDRLNKAFNCNWGLEIKEHKVIDDEVLVWVALNVYSEEGVFLTKQEGFGSAKKFKNVDLGNVYKSATSKAIKSAARNWGVGLFLEEEEEDYDNSTKSAPNISMPSIGTAMGTSFPGSQPSQASVEEVPAASATPIVNAAPPQAKTTTPPGTSTPPVAAKNNTPSSLPSMVSVPGMTTTPLANTTNEKGENSKLTMVQKVAINTRLASKGTTFEEIATDFYTGRDSVQPVSLDDMLYADALDMVTFLNSK